MGLTPPLDVASDTWLDLKQTQDKAQLVSGPIKLKQNVLKQYSWAKLCTIKVIFLTLKP